MIEPDKIPSPEHDDTEANESRLTSVKPWTAVVPATHSEPPKLRASVSQRLKLADGTVIKDAEFRFATSWVYYRVVEDQHGVKKKEVLFVRGRYNYKAEDSKIYKTYRTWYAIKYDEGGNGWACTGTTEKLLPMLAEGRWPLYGLDLLNHFDAAEVWLVEGEKAADYINTVLKPRGVVAVSASVYGALTSERAVNSYDLSVLKHRRVVVWPDNDERGKRMGRLLTAMNPTWRMVDYPSDTPRSWDVADQAETPLSRDLVDLAKAAQPNPTGEPFLRTSYDYNDMPRPGDKTNEGRRIEYWRPLRPELSIDNAIPVLTNSETLFNMSGRTVGISERVLVGAHVLGTEDKEPVKAKLMFEPPANVVAEQVNRCVEFGLVVTEEDDNGTEFFHWAPKNTPVHVGAVIRGRQAQGLSQLVGVIDYPAFDNKGRLLQGSGYDKATMLYLNSPQLNIRFGDTEQRAKASWQWLQDNVFCDVLFEADVDRAMAVAAPLTLMVKRSHFIATPGVLVNAFIQKTGKTTLCNMWSLMVLNARCAASPYGTDEAERQRQLISFARQGPAMIVFDNIPDNGIIDDATHSRFITSTVVNDRLLGASETIEAYSTFLMVYNGNNISKGTDIASRLYEVRLFSPTDKPELRKFKHPDAEQYVVDNRLEILRHLATIYAANQAANSPKYDASKNTRFLQWDRAVRSAVEFASGIDPVRPEEQGDLPADLGALKAFLEVLWTKQALQKHQHDKGVLAVTARKILDDPDLKSKFEELYYAANGVSPGNLNARAVSALLRKYRQRPVGLLSLNLLSGSRKTTLFGARSAENKPQEPENIPF